MSNQKKLRRKLKEMQKEHSELLKKIEKGNAQVQKRGQRLRVLEKELAELEQSFAGSLSSDDAGALSEQTKPVQHAQLLFNPKSARVVSGETSLEEITNMLRMHGIEVEVIVKTSGRVICDGACDAVARGDKLVIVAGGDGTIEKVAAELVGSETVLGILPIGTMNNLARALGVPLDLEDACALIGMGATRKIDVGHVNVKAKKHVKYFLESAGLGLSAIALPLGQNVKKGIWGDLPNALRRIIGFKPAQVSVELDDGQVITANASVVTVSNAPLTGVNFLIAPNAKMDDGWLDVAIYDGIGKRELVSYLMSAHNGTIVENPKIKRYRARHVRIQADELQERVSDKDQLAVDTGLEIEIIPQALQVIVGKGIALTFPVEVAPSVPPLSGPQTTNGHEPQDEPEHTAVTEPVLETEPVPA